MKTKRKNRKGKVNSIGALPKARSKYKERGDAASCGDWLALALKEYCHGDEGFNISTFERVLRENKIEWDLDRNKPGWVGRSRMNGRQKLAAQARRQGYIVIDGEKIRAPKAKRGRKAKTADAG